MISFESDYTTGCHEAILKRMLETNREPVSGYGMDPYSLSAKEKIRKAIACPDADIYFLSGGTQTNSVIIATMLAPYEGVVAAETGHVGVHEAGAVEYTGHKVLTLPQHEGKLQAEELQQYLQNFYEDGNHTHMVYPGMVYISWPTEYGTLYSKEELTAISGICRSYEIPLFVDGARLGYGLMSREADLTLPELAALCDVFYIGGTKVGALLGEAVVFPRNNAPRHFYTMTKQHGAMLAKGKLLGIQFDTLFTDNLYFEISEHAIMMAEKLKAIIHESGLKFYLESPTNQQFVILKNAQLQRLGQKVAFSFWEKLDEEHTAIRLVSSWSTREEDLVALQKALEELREA